MQTYLFNIYITTVSVINSCLEIFKTCPYQKIIRIKCIQLHFFIYRYVNVTKFAINLTADLVYTQFETSAVVDR